MRKSTLRGLLAGLVGLVLLVGGLATASNMGFKFVPNVAAGSYFNLALPWNNNYTAANGMFNDLHGQDANVAQISKVEAAGNYTTWYPGAAPANNYPVVKGEAYIMKAGAGPIQNAVVVGSHDPNFTFSFTAGQYKDVAAPYHQTFTVANALFNDMNTQLGAASISQISKVEAAGNYTSWYSGAAPANNFSLNLGMGVIVKANNTVAGYVWPHY